jgi:hypothetical protein
MCKYKKINHNTNWLLFQIHAAEKAKHKGQILSFWAKLGLWLRDKL